MKVFKKAYISFFCAILLCTSCIDNVVLHTYSHVSPDEWEKLDDVSISSAALNDDGEYAASVEIRNNNEYPFTQLILRIETTVYPSLESFVDTVRVPMASKKGTYSPRGIMYHQHSEEFLRARFAKGDSVVFNISHCMKRSTLPAITDVGIKMQKVK